MKEAQCKKVLYVKEKNRVNVIKKLKERMLSNSYFIFMLCNEFYYFN